MKIKNILKEIKIELLHPSEISEQHRSLCSAAEDCLSLEDKKTFKDYLRESFKNKHWSKCWSSSHLSNWNYALGITKDKDFTFMWKPYNLTPRIKWLDKHIALNS